MTPPLGVPAGVRAFERAVLLYSPVWIATVAVVMLSGVLAGWRDLAHLVFGCALAVPVLCSPWVPGAIGEERARPTADRYASRAVLYLSLTTLVQMALGSILFFDRLGMEYHFHVTWTWNRSPVFLYPMTLAYFATYYVLMQLVLRAVPDAVRGPRRWLVIGLVSYAVAFAETAFMASPLLDGLFFYRDKHFMLLYGSFCYGTVFAATLPGFLRLTEPRPLRSVVLDAAIGNAIALALYALYALVLPSLPRF
jgi:cycloeucalenol cycloisomerase